MPIEEIIVPVDYPSRASDIIKHYPRLKEAIIFYQGIDAENFLSRTQTFDELGIKINKIQDPIRSASWTNLTSLKCTIKNVEDGKFLKNLINLKVLVVTIDCNFERDDDLDGIILDDSSAYKDVLETVFEVCLEKLTIHPPTGANLNPTKEFLASRDKSEEFNLIFCAVFGSIILRCLPKLRKLSFRDCFASDGMKFWEFIDRPDAVEGKTLNQISELIILNVRYGSRSYWVKKRFCLCLKCRICGGLTYIRHGFTSTVFLISKFSLNPIL